jgi:hypothetical protein
MATVGHLAFNGALIPHMDLGAKLLRCDLDHATDPSRCLRDHVVRVEAQGSHLRWVAKSSVLGEGIARDHPVSALLWLVAARGYVLLKGTAANGDDVESTRTWIGKS